MVNFQSLISTGTIGGFEIDPIFSALLGSPNGVATLDGGGDVPLSQLGNVPSGLSFPLTAPDGSSAIPSYAFANDTDTGIFLYPGTALAFVTGGIDALYISTVGQRLQAVINGTEVSPVWTFANDTGAGMWFESGNNNVCFSTGGNLTLRLYQPAQQLQARDGTVGEPAYTFQNDNTTGMSFDSGLTELSLSLSGTAELTISAGKVTIPNRILANDGSVTAPSYAFTNSTDQATGMYYDAAGGELRFAGGNPSGNDMMRLVPGLVIGGADANTALGSSSIRWTSVNVAATGLKIWGAAGAANPIIDSLLSAGVPSLRLGPGGATTPDIRIERSATTTMQLVASTAVITTGPLRTPAGSVGIPSHSFSGDTDTGVYNPGADILGITTAGVERMRVTTTQILSAIAGSPAAPAISFTNDTDCGIYSDPPNRLTFASGGIRHMEVNASGVLITGDSTNALIVTNTVAATILSVNGTTQRVGIGTSAPTYDLETAGSFGVDSFINFAGTGGAAASSAGQARIEFDGTDLRASLSGAAYVAFLFSTPQLLLSDGTAIAPTYSFSSSTGSGMFFGGGSLQFATIGVLRLSMDSAAIYPEVPIYNVNGTVSDPAYAFDSESNTGMYWVGAAQVAIALQGVDTLIVGSTNFEIFSTQILMQDGNSGNPAYSFASDAGAGMYTDGTALAFALASNEQLRLEEPASGNTAMLIRINDGTTTVEQVSFGAADSGGTGFRLLRIPN